MQRAMRGQFTLPCCIEVKSAAIITATYADFRLLSTNASLYRPFVLQACESVRSSRLYEDFPWERPMNGRSVLDTTISSASFHQRSLNLIIMRPKLVSGLQPEWRLGVSTHCLSCENSVSPNSSFSFHVATSGFV